MLTVTGIRPSWYFTAWLPIASRVRLTWLPMHGFVLSGSQDIHAGIEDELAVS